MELRIYSLKYLTRRCTTAHSTHARSLSATISIAQQHVAQTESEQTSTHDPTCSLTQSLNQFTVHVIYSLSHQLFTPLSGRIYCILLFYPLPISTYNLARLTPPPPAPPGHLSPVTENTSIHSIANNVLCMLCNNGFSPP